MESSSRLPKPCAIWALQFTLIAAAWGVCAITAWPSARARADEGASKEGASEVVGDTVAPPPSTVVARDTRAFAVALYDVLAAQPGNIVFSPYQVARSLVLATSGAPMSPGMRALLQWHVSDAEMPAAYHDLDNELISGTLFAARGASFGNLAFKVPAPFGIDVLGAHSNPRAWIKEQTGQMFDLAEAFAPPTSNAVLIAGRIDAKWDAPGGKRAASTRQYRTRDGKRRETRTFTDKARLRYSENEQFQLVELTYDEKRWALIIALPKDSNDTLQHSPSSDELRHMIDQLEPTRVKIDLPAFNVSSTYKLRAALIKMGLEPTKGKTAGIREVIHKASLRVDEHITQGGMATAVRLDSPGGAAPAAKNGPLLDRPFLFMVVDAVWSLPLLFGRVERL